MLGGGFRAGGAGWWCWMVVLDGRSGCGCGKGPQTGWFVGPYRHPPFFWGGVFGGVLLSHILAGAVPSALKGLASGFGMGPGVSLSP